MTKMDSTSWGEFKLGYLVDKKTGKLTGSGLFGIYNSVAYHKKDIEETDDSNPNGLNYITRSKFNNGLKCKVVNNRDYKINPSGTISFGAENADFFYQTEEYITGNKMYYIDTTNLSETACYFLKSVLEATFTANYSFSDGMIPTRIYDEKIKLPIGFAGEPDWKYIEDYMRTIEVKVVDKISKLKTAIDIENKKIDISEWKQYTITQLFDVLKGRSKISNVDLDENGIIPVYSSTSENNGVFGYTMITAAYKVSKEIPFYLIFGDHTKSMFIANKDFNTMDNVKVLIPHLFNEYVTRFITTRWFASFPNVGYSRHWSLAQKSKFYLPTKDDKPDWDYMEQYMKSIENMVKIKIDVLSS